MGNKKEQNNDVSENIDTDLLDEELTDVEGSGFGHVVTLPVQPSVNI